MTVKRSHDELTSLPATKRACSRHDPVVWPVDCADLSLAIDLSSQAIIFLNTWEFVVASMRLLTTECFRSVAGKVTWLVTEAGRASLSSPGEFLFSYLASLYPLLENTQHMFAAQLKPTGLLLAHAGGVAQS